MSQLGDMIATKKEFKMDKLVPIATVAAGFALATWCVIDIVAKLKK